MYRHVSFTYLYQVLFSNKNSVTWGLFSMQFIYGNAFIDLVKQNNNILFIVLHEELCLN